MLHALPAHAGDPRLVMPGKEVVVSFPQGGAMRAAARSVDKLAAPGHLRVLPIKGSYSIGVASAAAVASSQSIEPVPVNDAAIAAVCGELRRANPGTTMVCEPNLIYRATKIPNDPRYSSQYGHTKISSPAAWDLATGSSSVLVGIIDTGIDYQHPDLEQNIAVNSGEVRSNGVDDDGNGRVDDYYGYDFANDDGNPMDDDASDGHGTHCAGTVGARGDNDGGIAGVNWRVGLVAVKVLDAQGNGFLSDIAAGIDYAVDRGAAVVSLSLGGPSDSATLENAITRAKQQGVLVVVAAGNESENNDIVPSYPANSPSDNVLSIAATNSSDALASFSNYGADTVDIAAPGAAILSTFPGGTYVSESGTSMAAPFVAGVAALMKSANTSLSYGKIRDLILSSADDVAGLNGKVVTGGRLNAAAAVEAALGVPTPTPTPAPDTNALTLSIERGTRRSYLFGEITGPTGAIVSGEQVTLMCGGRGVASKLSDAEGYYEFARRRPRVPVRCYVRDSAGTRSRTRMLR